MSLPEQERRALRETWEFLLALGDSYGPWKNVPSNVRQAARDRVRHFPLGGAVNAKRWAAEEGDSA